jgi:hypothetical protein
MTTEEASAETPAEFSGIWGYALGDPVVEVHPRADKDGRVGHADSFNGAYVTVKWENGDPDTIALPGAFTKMPTGMTTQIYRQLHKMAGRPTEQVAAPGEGLQGGIS